MIDDGYAQYHLKRERIFLFLSIIIAATLLGSFPESLKRFILGTTNSITGGVTAVEAVGIKDYFIGLVIFAALAVFLGYLVHVLRNPRPERWLPQFSDEEEITASVGKEMDLGNNLELVNAQIRKLRAEKEAAETVLKRKAKKIVKTPDANEIELEYNLKKITAQLQGYQKTPPGILELPAGKGQWDNDLELVKKELSSIDEMKIKKAGVREEVPSEKDIALRHEYRKLQAELKEAFSKKKRYDKIMVLEEPQQQKRWNEDLEKVNAELGNVDQMKIKKVKIREDVPVISKIIETLEQKKLVRELQRLHQTLEEEEKNASYSVKRFIPATREWQLANIKKKIGKKGAVKNKEELAEIEEKLAGIYSK